MSKLNKIVNTQGEALQTLFNGQQAAPIQEQHKSASMGSLVTDKSKKKKKKKKKARRSSY